jgi:2-oxoglutarate ferredoxin oxidoreductase subunit alpha
MTIGASFAGARAMTGTSGGGFSLMVEGLGLAGISETPIVVTDVQRPGPATGFPTRTEQADLKFLISASQGEFPRMVIALKNHADAFYQTHRALNLAEKYQMPVLILSDQYLGDSSSTVGPFDLDKLVETTKPATDAETPYKRYRLTDSGVSPRLLPGKSDSLVLADSDEHDERGRITESAGVRIDMVRKRMRKLALLEEELQEPEFIGSDAFDTLLVGWGSAWGPIYEAVTLLNGASDRKYAALVFGDVWPLPKKRLTEKAVTATALINVEQNATGQLALLIREQAGIAMTGSVLKYDGRQLSGEEIAERVGRGDFS